MLFPVIRCINFQQILVAHLRRSYYLPAAVSVVGGCRIFLSIYHVVIIIINASCCRVIIVIDDAVSIAYPPVVIVADLLVDGLRIMQRILITIITMTVAITATIIPINIKINISIEIRSSRFIALLVLVDIMDNLHSSRCIDVMLLDVLLVEL